MTRKDLISKEAVDFQQTFSDITDRLQKLDPRYWKNLLYILDHHIKIELERLEVIPETICGIAGEVRLAP